MPVGAYTGPNVSNGNGVATVFPYDFQILDQDHLVVEIDGVVQTSGYTVSGVGESGGGNVTFDTAPADGAEVLRYREVPYTREVDYQRNGNFDEETVDRDQDLKEMQIQQLEAIAKRAPKAPRSVGADQAVTQAEWDGRAGRVWGFDAVGKLALLIGQAGSSLVDLAASTGASLVGFIQNGAGAILRTLLAKSRAVVSVEDFGTNTTPGTTDMSAAILAAVAALPSSGGVVEFEKADRYACNLGAITKGNVCFRAKGFIEDTGINAQLVPVDPDEYVLEVGDGTTLCRGFRTEGVSLNGLGVGKYGLKINGADRCHYSQFSAAGFTVHDVYITSSATHPTTYQFFDTFSISAQNGATAIGLEIDYGSQYVAAIFFNNGTIGGQASSLWALKMTRVRAHFSNVWIQGFSGKCVSLNTSGGSNAVMECANVFIDSDSSSDVLVNVDSNTRPNGWMRGLAYVDGLFALSGGNTAALTGGALLPPNAFLASCFVNGSGLFFLDVSGSEWTKWDQSQTQMSISRGGSSFFFTNTLGGLNFTAAAGGQIRFDGRTKPLVDSNGQRITEGMASAVVSTPSGATVTASNLIPANSIVLGITCRVTGTISGASSFSVGDGTDADRWGAGIAVAPGTTTNVSDFTIASPVYYGAANNVVLTAAGSDFTGGQVRITVHYVQLTPATS